MDSDKNTIPNFSPMPSLSLSIALRLYCLKSLSNFTILRCQLGSIILAAVAIMPAQILPQYGLDETQSYPVSLKYAALWYTVYLALMEPYTLKHIAYQLFASCLSLSRVTETGVENVGSDPENQPQVCQLRCYFLYLCLEASF